MEHSVPPTNASSSTPDKPASVSDTVMDGAVQQELTDVCALVS